MPSRPCLTCGALSSGSYCPRHKPKAKPRNPKRGSGWAAQRWARKVKATTGGRCARCGSTRDVQAHHVRPLAQGGDPFGPGVPLCARCHARCR